MAAAAACLRAPAPARLVPVMVSRFEEELRFGLHAFAQRSPQGGVAAKAPTKAAKDPPDTMRVLCLHGYLQNGDVFKQKTGSLRRVLKGCEFTFLDAPHEAEPFPDATGEDAEASASAEGGVLRGWWSSGENQCRKDGQEWVRPAQSFSYFGFEEGVTYARAAAAEALGSQGSFDGVLAFSQGCAVTTALLREAQSMEGHPLASVRFVILVGGFVPKDPAVAAKLRGDGDTRLSLQSLHVSGVNDVSVPRLRSEALAELYEPSQVAWFDHPGRHGLPNGTGAFKQELQALLSRSRGV
ncbi:unnamed protein product [Durusdinium trenchii]|uniref:Serine hydrolase domain-containing protein n=2 Tax=Durusdinium trenchii TaxID=1381693 RepID=A0ABP0KAY7_9DINO